MIADVIRRTPTLRDGLPVMREAHELVTAPAFAVTAATVAREPTRPYSALAGC